MQAPLGELWEMAVRRERREPAAYALLFAMVQVEVQSLGQRAADGDNRGQ